MEQTVIFDFDRTIGTLVIDWTDWKKQIKDLILEFDKESSLDLEQIRHSNQNDFIKRHGPNFRDRLNEINERAELTLVSDFVVNKKILDYINRTENELYCWSSNSRKTLDKYFKEMNIYNSFQNIISREDVYLLKPDNEGFQYIHEESKSLDDYLLIGDSDADRIAAIKCGIKFIHVDEFNPN